MCILNASYMYSTHFLDFIYVCRKSGIVKKTKMVLIQVFIIKSVE